MDVKQIDAGELNVGYVDAGPEYGPDYEAGQFSSAVHPRTRHTVQECP